MTTNTELIARAERVASELDDHNANMDRRARTCIRELLATLKSVEQAITDPENQPSQFGTVTLTMYKSLTQQLAERDAERDSFKERWEENEIENGEQQSQIENLEAEVERLKAEIEPLQVVNQRLTETKCMEWNIHEHNALRREIAWLKAHTTAQQPAQQAQPEPFTPDWSQDSAAADSIREHQAICNLLLKEMRYIAGISAGQVKRVAEQALEAVKQAQPECAPLYSLDTDSQGIRARTVHAVLGALVLGANNENKPPSGHWLAEIWDIARAEREGAVDRVTTLFESDEPPYLPDIARAIDGAAHGIKQGGQQ